MNVLIGAAIAFVIAFGGNVLTALNGEAVMGFQDISDKQWAIMFIAPLISALKDYQAVATRRVINKFTKSGDGGGSGPFEKQGDSNDDPNDDPNN